MSTMMPICVSHKCLACEIFISFHPHWQIGVHIESWWKWRMNVSCHKEEFWVERNIVLVACRGRDYPKSAFVEVGAGPEHIWHRMPAMWYGSPYQHMLDMKPCLWHRPLELVREEMCLVSAVFVPYNLVRVTEHFWSPFLVSKRQLPCCLFPFSCYWKAGNRWWSGGNYRIFIYERLRVYSLLERKGSPGDLFWNSRFAFP